MRYKSLHNEKDFTEIIERIQRLSENSQKKWGKNECFSNDAAL